MPTLKANHRQILAAKAIDGKETRYRIQGVPGLWLYVSKTGSRTWYARYQVGSGKHRRERWYRLGDAKTMGLADASKQAHDVRNKSTSEGRDPQAERKIKRADTLTFDALFQEWYERHAQPKLARAEDDQALYKHHLEAGLGRRLVADIRRVDIGKLRDDLAKSSGPMGSNNVIILVNRVFNWGVDEGMIEYNPGARMRKAGKRKARERVLSADEIRNFWGALAAMELMTGEHMARAESGRMLTPATRSVLRLLLLTGQRRVEVSGATKAELDLSPSDPVWTIPGDRTKNRLLHRVPLTSMAVAEFKQALSLSPKDSDYVFPSAVKGKDAPILASTITKAMARLTDEIGIKGASPHDLRRTVGTELARLRLDLTVRKLVLNHSPRSGDITDAVYNRYAYDLEKREALTKWEERLKLIFSRQPRHVAKPPAIAA